jgi:adenylate cyclase
MRNPPRILAVDDVAENLEILQMRLESRGYEVVLAADGEAALAAVREQLPDLILLDIMMPKMDGIEVTRRLKADTSLPFIPIILVTAKADDKDVVAGLDAGGDDYLTKPFEHAALVARVRSMLRIKELHDEVRRQAAQLADWNAKLEERIATQLAEIERIGRLKRFLAPQIAEMIVSAGSEQILDSHRRDIIVLFCDLRGFTAFAESAEPEDIIAVLQEYYQCLGESIDRFEGTLQHFAGDGLLIIFNDPLPCTDPALRAVRMAVEMRGRVAALVEKWRRFGHELGFGVGIASGHATLGSVGYEGRFHYSANGTVVNLGSRLCTQAADGQILIDGRVQLAVEAIASTEPIGDLDLKGFHRPVRAFNVRDLMA